MDSLHNVIRSIRETKSRPDHLTIFREFITHLDRVAKRGRKAARPKRPPSKRAGKS